MNINLILDPTAQAAPQAVKDAWNQAANILDFAITDQVTVNIHVTWGVKDGNTAGSFGAPDGGQKISYQAYYDQLTFSSSAGDSTFSALPSGPSIQGSTQIALFNAQLKVLGLLNPTDTTTDDGTVDFGTGTPIAEMVGAALHEFTHVLGRFPVAGTDPSVFDLDRFTNQGTRTFWNTIPAPPAYFSLNNGFSEWANYGQNSDPADFLNDNLTINDAFDEFGDSNLNPYLTPLDLEQLDALGYHLRINAPAIDNQDFNGDNSGDILVHNSSGQIYYANMTNGSFNNWVAVANTPGWNVVGEGKISGGKSSDVVIQDDNGNIEYANIGNSGNFSNWVNYNAQIPGWKVVGVGDINCDHHCDIVIQSSSGQIDYALTSASGVTSGALDHYVSVANTPGWNVVGVGDVNCDGYSDIVIQNTSTGQIDYANMAGGNFCGWGAVATAPGWNVVGVGDIDRNGAADIVVQDSSSGAIDYVQMNRDGTFGRWVQVGTASGWKVIGVEDILANGYDDIVIQNTSTGDIDYADMTLGRFNNWVSVTSAPGFSGGNDSSGLSAVGPISMTDPGPEGTDLISGPTMFDPAAQNGNVGALNVFDPGPQGNAVGPHQISDAGLQGSSIAGLAMFDPGPQASISNWINSPGNEQPTLNLASYGSIYGVKNA